MKKTLSIIGTVVKALVVILLAAFIVYDATILIQKYAFKRDMPQIFGYSTAVVVSDSMYPAICKGDLIIIKVGAEYAKGDVITYYESSTDSYITHRIVGVNADGSCTTQGDNNDSADSAAVTEDMVYGKVVSTISGAGTFIMFLQEPAGLALVLVVAVLIWLIAVLISHLTKKE